MQENKFYLQMTILKLIDQCGHHCIINNKPAFHNLCESAFEWAWNALGIEEDYIYAEDFYQTCRLKTPTSASGKWGCHKAKWRNLIYYTLV